MKRTQWLAIFAFTMLAAVSVMAAEEPLLGIWYSEISMPKQGLALRGTTEYLRNHTTKSYFELTVTVIQESFTNKYSYDVVQTGEWQMSGDKLVEKLVDTKSIPRFWIANGEKVDLSTVDAADGAPTPERLEDVLPNGLSQEKTIVELGKDTITLKFTDDAGNEQTETLQRRDKHFQFTQTK